MIHQMITIHDCKAQMYKTPLYFKTLGMAKRAWLDILNDPETEFARHPADYTLIHLGTFDDDTGVCDLLTPAQSLGSGQEFLAITEPLEVPEMLKANGQEPEHPNE